MDLTPEVLKKLAEPFPASAISVKVQTKPNEKGNALCVAYIDARDVMDRLDEVVGGEWSDDYRTAPSGGLECALTVCGVTRRDVGDDDNSNAAANKEKAGYSDAFKRAAVKFGIGRFLYSLPKMYASVKQVGNGVYLAEGEEVRLKKLISQSLGGKDVKQEVATQRRAEEMGIAQPAEEKAVVMCNPLNNVSVKWASSQWNITPKQAQEAIEYQISEGKMTNPMDKAQFKNIVLSGKKV